MDINSLLVRPRFAVPVSLKPAEVLQRIWTYSGKNNQQIDTTLVKQHANLRFSDEYQHFWSPQLNLEVVEEGGQTLLKGLFGPNPKVWTMFFFFYSGLGFLALVGLIYGGVQWSLKMAPTGFWLMTAALILEGVFYLFARTGKRLAADQMQILRGEIFRILSEPRPIYQTPVPAEPETELDPVI
jgi:hypothetical protein